MCPQFVDVLEEKFRKVLKWIRGGEAVLIDLSQAPDDVLILILQQVPAMDLIKACTMVSKRWNRILSTNSFWRQKLEEEDGLDWRKLAGLEVSPNFYQLLAVKQPFHRNFIRDGQLDGPHMDKRWVIEEQAGTRIDILPCEKPIFLDGKPVESPLSPQLAHIIGKRQRCFEFPVESFHHKAIPIRLADEGLTDDLMDNFRPTIVVSELVCNLSEAYSTHILWCVMMGSDPIVQQELNDNELKEKEEKHIIMDEKHLEFKLGDAEGMHLVRYKFKQYPAGMRLLNLSFMVRTSGGAGNATGEKLKVLCPSVMALFERNVPEEEVEQERELLEKEAST